jgi:hypothetical protein
MTAARRDAGGYGFISRLPPNRNGTGSIIAKAAILTPMPVDANFVLPACRRVRATVPRGHLVVIGLLVGALATTIALAIA